VLKKILKNRNVLSILISILIFIIIFIISLTNFFYVSDKKISDLYFKFNDIKVNKDIVLVEIDEETLSWKRDINWNIIKKWLWRFPFDRSHYARVIDNLYNANAAVIGIDIIFWEESNSKSDKELSESIKNAWNVVMWLWVSNVGKVIKPYKMFYDYSLISWYVIPNKDKLTKVVYSIKPFSRFNSKLNNETYEHFTISVVRWFYSNIYKNDKYLNEKPIYTKNKIYIGDKIELLRSREDSNDVLINYVRSSKFNKISFLEVFSNNFDKKRIENKIVLIWVTAKWIKDIFDTPLWTEFWVYTHANMINTILTKQWIKYLDTKIEWLLIFLIIIVSVYFNISKSSYILIFSNISLVSLFILWTIYVIIYTNTLLNFPIELALSLILSLAISNVAKYLIENRNKEKLNKALSEYVSVDVAKEILSWEWKINLDWENKKIAIFFSDIEWFTSISEKFSPEELVWFLREYLSDMSDIIMDEKWFINKYEWDAIMALWGVFWDDKDKSKNICLSALKQQEKLKELNKIWSKRGFSEIKARIGMHLGEAIIWNIWSEWRKMEFTALWDSVNLASRLEWVNKFYWTYICASEDIYKKEKENFEFRYLDQIKVKWKEIPIKIYELLWIKWKVSPEKLEIKELFEKAVSLYLNREFIKARTIFKKLIWMWDNAWKMYLDMCEIYIKNPPWDDWNGVATMTWK